MLRFLIVIRLVDAFSVRVGFERVTGPPGGRAVP
jgi:hypothetical protein